MLSCGLPQASPTKYFRARNDIDTQKFPVVRNAIKSHGITNIEQIIPIQALVMGNFGENLSLSIPPAMAERNPKQQRLSAFKLANDALKPGYTCW